MAVKETGKEKIYLLCQRGKLYSGEAGKTIGRGCGRIKRKRNLDSGL